MKNGEKLKRVEWMVRKPGIAILIDLYASACQWQTSGRDDIKEKLVRFIAPYAIPAVSAVKNQPQEGFWTFR
jgi:hypothetical protein